MRSLSPCPENFSQNVVDWGKLLRWGGGNLLHEIGGNLLHEIGGNLLHEIESA